MCLYIGEGTSSDWREAFAHLLLRYSDQRAVGGGDLSEDVALCGEDSGEAEEAPGEDHLEQRDVVDEGSRASVVVAQHEGVEQNVHSEKEMFESAWLYVLVYLLLFSTFVRPRAHLNLHGYIYEFTWKLLCSRRGKPSERCRSAA